MPAMLRDEDLSGGGVAVAEELVAADGGVPETGSAAAITAPVVVPSAPDSAAWRPLLWQLTLLSLPLIAENLLHIGVGLTDTYLANNVIPLGGLAGDALAQARSFNANAAAAVGSTTYLLWFLGLMTGAVGTGSTALIARATGARDKRTARSAVGQSVMLAFLSGLVLCALFFVAAGPISRNFGLSDPEAQHLIYVYIRILTVGIPLATITFIGNACLRGAGDTLTPAIAMIVIDLVNIVLSFGLCYGLGPFPKWGFDGIVWGTSIAYGGGAFVVMAVLLHGAGSSGLKLFWHRMRPARNTIRRIFKVGIPSGAEGLIFWGANFVVLFFVNTLGVVPAAAHNIVIRIEAFSYMTGYAVATAAATMVGQSLGMNDPRRARKSGFLAYGVGGGVMAGVGLLFIAFPQTFCGLVSNDPTLVATSAGALRVAGFTQIAFAAMMIFGGALRGAGDTTAVMTRNLGSAILVRMLGALLAVRVFGFGLTVVWAVLGLDMCIRGGLLAARFYHGKWETLKV